MFSLSIRAVQVLIYLIPVLFGVLLFLVLWALRSSATGTTFHLRTALATGVVSLVFGVITGWFVWWLSFHGPSNDQISYRGNGALAGLITLALGVVLFLGITLANRAWWAAVVALVIPIALFAVTYNIARG